MGREGFKLRSSKTVWRSYTYVKAPNGDLCHRLTKYLAKVLQSHCRKIYLDFSKASYIYKLFRETPHIARLTF